MSHMPNSSTAREFPVETDFQKKARRPGGVTRNQAVGDAQAQIETLKEEFNDWLKDGLERLQSAIQLAETFPDNAMLVEDAFRSSCELRDIGTTMGYELVTFVANRLCEVLNAIRKGADYDKVLIRCHLDALQLARQDSYKNVSPDQVPDLCDGLRRAAEHSNSLAGRIGK
jgi:chemotaxis protein histidine kinase CheA